MPRLAGTGLAIALFLTVAGCDWLAPDHARVATTIEAALPLMTAARVEELALSEGQCEYLRYEGGEYLSGKRAPGVCHDREVPGSDELAAGHVAAIRQALGSAIARAFWAHLVYRDDGVLLRSSFLTGRCIEYRYEPLDTFPFGPGQVEDLGDDWWVITTEGRCSSSD